MNYDRAMTTVNVTFGFAMVAAFATSGHWWALVCSIATLFLSTANIKRPD